MRKIIMVVVLGVSLVIAGCGKKESASKPATAPKAPTSAPKAAPAKAKVTEKKPSAPETAPSEKKPPAPEEKAEESYSVSLEIDGAHYLIDEGDLTVDVSADKETDIDNSFTLEAYGENSEISLKGIIPKASGISKQEDLINKQLKIEYDDSFPDVFIIEPEKSYAAKVALLTINSISGETAKGVFSGTFVEIKDGELDEKSEKQIKGQFTASLTIYLPETK